MMNRYTKRVYYSFEDLVTMSQGATRAYGNINILYFYGIGVEFDGVANEILASDEAILLMNKYIYPKYGEDVIAWYDLPLDEEPIAVHENASEEELSIFRSFVKRFADILVSTYDRYKKLIDSAEAIKDKLLDQVESSTEVKNRFNDTPQNASPDFWNDDEHATNVSIQTQVNKAAISTPIQRLAEVEANLKDYYTMWAYEFSELFKAED